MISLNEQWNTFSLFQPDKSRIQGETDYRWLKTLPGLASDVSHSRGSPESSHSITETSGEFISNVHTVI